MSHRRRRLCDARSLPDRSPLRRPLEPRRYKGTFAYKYRTIEHLERLKEILLGDMLFFPAAKDLNDSEEARPKLVSSSPDGLLAAWIKLNMVAKPFRTNHGLAADTAAIESLVRGRG